MIPWWVALIALVVGELFGVIVPQVCGVNENKGKYFK